MRRSLVAVMGVLALVAAMAGVAVAGAVSGQRGDVSGYRMHRLMSSWGEPGGGPDSHWWVGTEFDYLTEMVAHHEEAVAAAEDLSRSNRPQLRAFAASIVKTQSAQIDRMNRWLAQWYPGRSTDVDYQPMMRDLSGLTGDELDRVFLRDMIVHHMAAVRMSQHLLIRGAVEHAAVEVLATSIRGEQHAEILQMRRWLADWYGVGWGHGIGRGMTPGMMS